MNDNRVPDTTQLENELAFRMQAAHLVVQAKQQEFQAALYARSRRGIDMARSALHDAHDAYLDATEAQMAFSLRAMDIHPVWLP